MLMFKVALELADGSHRETTCGAADEIGALYAVASALAAGPERPRVVRAAVEVVEADREKWNIVVPPKRDPRAVDGALVDRYRKAAAINDRAFRLHGHPEEEQHAELQQAAIELADDVLHRADAISPLNLSLARRLLLLACGAKCTLGNPMSGLGCSATVQIALEALDEIEMLLGAWTRRVEEAT